MPTTRKPTFVVHCREKFVVRTTYHNVEADSKEEAAAKVKAGECRYASFSPEPDNGEPLEIVEVEEETCTKNATGHNDERMKASYVRRRQPPRDHS